MPALSRTPLKTIVISLLAAVIAVALFFQYIAPSSIKKTLIANGAVQYFLHSYHAFRKLPDIVFFPYWFMKSDLPVYNLIVDEKDLAVLEAALPQDPIGGTLNEENRISVKGTFLTKEYEGKVDVRYRGTNANHWNSQKRSWRVDFHSNNYFERMSGLNLVIPGDRGYYAELLNVYRAKKLGLTVPDIRLVRLKVNTRDYGVYLAYEAWSSAWVEKQAMPANGNLISIDDTLQGKTYVSAFTRSGIRLWKSYMSTPPPDTGYNEIRALVELLTEADDDTFAALIPHIMDMNKVYAWDIVNILANSSHQDDKNNGILFFNTATGKLEPISWDVGFNTSATNMPYEEGRTLEKRIFTIPAFRAERDRILKQYIDDPRNQEDDFAFYDTLVSTTRGDFFRDNVKLDNNIAFLLDTRALRNAILKNTQNAHLVLNAPAQKPNPKPAYAGILTLPETFKYLPEAAASGETFVRTHPQFSLGADNTIRIAGTHTFPKTIVVPAGYTFIIEPGTTLYLGAGASLVSYSPVHADGTAAQQIRILPTHAALPFGSFLVLDTADSAIPSRFSWVTIEGGSGTAINGVMATGMLALHAVGTAEITHSSFAHSFDDDALNIKYSDVVLRDNTFTDTFADAIDLDVVRGLVEGNTFTPIIGRDPKTKHAGDGIDMSYASNITVRGNHINGATDKCISIGEHSSPLIENNSLMHCTIGIAVKDLSRAIITGNTITDSGTAISLYRKKELFGGGSAVITGTILRNNKESVVSDTFSTYETDTSF